MRAAGDTIFSKLKSKTILSRKPNLKICSNHQKDEGPRVYRYWDSMVKGTAYSDGKGWYISGVAKR